MSFENLKQPIYLSYERVSLVPLSLTHTDALSEIAQRGNFGRLRVTSTPDASQTEHYIEQALLQKNLGQRYPFAVLDTQTGKLLGTTSYHDILFDVQRLEIGYTWYDIEVQKNHVNTLCKYLLFKYAFETLQANTVGLRTDIFNFKSQKAIERLGVRQDGIIRGNALRKDGTIRDTVMYSVIAGEWINLKAHLLDLMQP